MCLHDGTYRCADKELCLMWLNDPDNLKQTHQCCLDRFESSCQFSTAAVPPAVAVPPRITQTYEKISEIEFFNIGRSCLTEGEAAGKSVKKRYPSLIASLVKCLEFDVQEDFICDETWRFVW